MTESQHPHKHMDTYAQRHTRKQTHYTPLHMEMQQQTHTHTHTQWQKDPACDSSVRGRGGSDKEDNDTEIGVRGAGDNMWRGEDGSQTEDDR